MICLAHNQIVDTHNTEGKCLQCALDDAELLLRDALRSFEGFVPRHFTTPEQRVLRRAQMWVNVARYSDKAQQEIIAREIHYRGSEMPALWHLASLEAQ